MKLGIIGSNDCIKFDYKTADAASLIYKCNKLFEELNPEELVVKLEPGIETIFTTLAIKKGIKVQVLIPYKGYCDVFEPETLKYYNKIVSNPLVNSFYIQGGKFNMERLGKANEWIVGYCDTLVYQKSTQYVNNITNSAKMKGKTIKQLT